MRDSGMTAPLRRPLFRRLPTTYAINELGDWMGIVALSVLVYEATDSPLATAGLFLGTRFLPAFLAPLLVTRIEKPPPRLVLPLIYCGETAAFGALALLASHFSLPAVIAAGDDRRHARPGRTGADPRRESPPLLEPTGRTARRQRAAERFLHRRRRDRAGTGRSGRRRTRGPDRALAERRLLLPGRLDPGHRRLDPPRRAGRGRHLATARAPASPICATTSRCAACSSPRALAFIFFSAVSRSRSSTRRKRLAPATPATASCSPPGGSGCSSAASSSPRLEEPRCSSSSSSPPWRSAPAIWVWQWPRPRRRLRRLGRRRYRQRRPVGFGDQRGSGVDRVGYAGPGYGGPGVDRSGDARGWIRPGRLDSCDCGASDDFPGRRTRGAGDRRSASPRRAEGSDRTSRDAAGFPLDESNDVVLELLPGGMPIPNSEVEF